MKQTALFVFRTKTTQPRAQVFSVNGKINLQERCTFDVIGSLNAKWSKCGHQ